MNKGLSQILWLIISASVLMMLALTVVALGQSGIQGIFGSADTTGCTSAIDSQLTVMEDGDTRSLPGSCFDEGEPIIAALDGCSPSDRFEADRDGGWTPICS